jgi:hypothetical protein
MAFGFAQNIMFWMKISKNLSDELSLKFGFDSALFLGEKN